jgi:hypothetical protein
MGASVLPLISALHSVATTCEAVRERHWTRRFAARAALFSL